ncbi:MAG: TrpB-like pyridoxal phosphate-dependent enzyme [Desulfobulbus sp.]|jgi:tryptophan synthase beta chain
MKKIVLREDEMPTSWYNVVPDIPNGLQPPLDPVTKKPIGPDKLSALFPMGLIEQEASQERFIKIPDEVLDIYRIWRPSPLVRATRLEEALGTKARIFYKHEGLSPVGSHKGNSAVAQAYYNKREGIKRLTTETGAGQWGSALAMATCMMGMECKVFMVRVSFDQKPYRKFIIQTYGGDVVASPSMDTEVGRRILAETPDTTGSLGMAVSEAIEEAMNREDTKYSLGSVLNHVVLHQTIIGLEAKKQMEIAGYSPDVVVGCCGGGSNFAGIVAPFVPDYLNGKKIEFVGYEPASCPSMTNGKLAYDAGDVSMMTPLLYMYTLGHSFVPPGFHAGGLRYHGMAPTISALVRENIVTPRAVNQLECFEAGLLFARTEGIIPAPETTHAIRGAIIEAMREPDRPKNVLFNFSGVGFVDMAAYDQYLSGELSDQTCSQEEIDASLARLPKID